MTSFVIALLCIAFASRTATGQTQLRSFPFSPFRLECPTNRGIGNIELRPRRRQSQIIGLQNLDTVFTVTCEDINTLFPRPENETLDSRSQILSRETCRWTTPLRRLNPNDNSTFQFSDICIGDEYLVGLSRIVIDQDETSFLCCNMPDRVRRECSTSNISLTNSDEDQISIGQEGLVIASLGLSYNDDRTIEALFCKIDFPVPESNDTSVEANDTAIVRNDTSAERNDTASLVSETGDDKALETGKEVEEVEKESEVESQPAEKEKKSKETSKKLKSEKRSKKIRIKNKRKRKGAKRIRASKRKLKGKRKGLRKGRAKKKRRKGKKLSSPESTNISPESNEFEDLSSSLVSPEERISSEAKERSVTDEDSDDAEQTNAKDAKPKLTIVIESRSGIGIKKIPSSEKTGKERISNNPMRGQRIRGKRLFKVRRSDLEKILAKQNLGLIKLVRKADKPEVAPEKDNIADSVSEEGTDETTKQQQSTTQETPPTTEQLKQEPISIEREAATPVTADAIQLIPADATEDDSLLTLDISGQTEGINSTQIKSAENVTSSRSEEESESAPKVDGSSTKNETCSLRDAYQRPRDRWIIACGDANGVWEPNRCPEEYTCSVVDETIYRVCCPDIE